LVASALPFLNRNNLRQAVQWLLVVISAGSCGLLSLAILGFEIATNNVVGKDRVRRISVFSPPSHVLLQAADSACQQREEQGS